MSEEPPIQKIFPHVDVDPGPGGGVAKVRLELPDTEVAGEVVTDSREPVPEALVRLYEEDAARNVVAWTDEDGRFTFRGIAEGVATVSAETEDAASDMATVSVSETTATPSLELVLRRRAKVRGRVLGSDGRGLPGVRVEATVFRDGLGLSQRVPGAVTDVEGSFLLELPAESTHFQVTAYPPGYTLTPLAVQPRSEEPLVIRPEPVGGSLTLQLAEPPDLRTPDPKPVLVHNGRIVSFVEILQWAQIMGQALGSTTTELRIPSLPVGGYRVCRARQGPFPEAAGGLAECRDVNLAPGADVHVTLGD